MLSTISLSAQTIDEWIRVHKGSYSGSQQMQNLSVGAGKYLAAVSCELAFDSANVVQCSDDGGNTWKNIYYAPCYPFNPFTGVVYNVWWREQYFQSVVRPSKDTIIVHVGRRPKNDTLNDVTYGTIYPETIRTTDGGSTWHEVKFTSGTRVAYFNNAMVMDDRTVGYAQSADSVSSNKVHLFRTTNAGESWHQLQHEDWTGTIEGLYANGANIIAAKVASQLYISTDSGTTFQKCELPQYSKFIAMRYPVIIAAGNSGGAPYTTHIHSSEDGGKTWRVVLNEVLPHGDIMDVDINERGDVIVLYRSGTMIVHYSSQEQTFTSLPYGTNSQVAVHVRWINNENAIATIQDAIILRTGRTISKPPALNAQRINDTTYTHKWNEQESDKKYHLQIAQKIKGSLPGLVLDNTIFDKPEAMLLDTMLTSTEYTKQYSRGYDIYARVRRITTTDTSDWSAQRIVRIPGAPSDFELSKPIMTSPMQGATVSAPQVEFVWYGDDRTTSWDLMITDKEPGAGAWEDSVAYNRRNLTSASSTVELPAGKKYYWYVIAYAEGFASEVTAGYRELTITASSINETESEKEVQYRYIVDLLGKTAQTESVEQLPSGLWLITTCYRDGTCTTEKVLR